MTKLEISLTQPQAEFLQLQDEALYCLFNGGYGCGKSHTLAVAAFLDALHCPNAIIGIYAPTYQLIRDPNMRYIQRMLDENGIKYDTNKNESTITTRSSQIGNFRFFSMDNPDTLIGYETYTAHIDEIDTLPGDKAEEVWNMILARTRQVPKDLPDCYKYSVNGKREPRNKVCAYSTPEGFKFTYKTWGKNRKKNQEGETYYEDPEYRFVQARTEDNPYIPQAYINNLKKKYSGPLIDAYLEGKWVNLTAGTVYYAYDIKEHDSKEEIKEGEALHIGMDFNVGNMCASVFVPRNGGSEWHQVAEIHGLLDTPDMINYIRDEWLDKGHLINIYPDCSLKNRSAQNATDGHLRQLKDAGFRVIKNREKNPNVVDRVACVNNGFAKNKIYVNSQNCPEQVECLTQQAYNKMDKPEKGTGFDHMNDAFGYFAYQKLNMRNAIQLLNFSFAQRI